MAVQQLSGSNFINNIASDIQSDETILYARIFHLVR